MKYSAVFALLLGFLVCSLSSLRAQSRIDFEDAAVHKGNVVVTLGYGAPSIVRAFLKIKTTRDQIQVAGSGPYIFKAEYMLGHRFGISLNAAYSQSRVYWYDYGFDTVLQAYREDFEFGIRAYELSGTLRGNYHFLKRKKIDAYAGLGAGYGLFNMRSYTNAHTTRFEIVYDVPKPLSLEATAGMRYFPVKWLGLYTEVGLGKSWILFNKYFLPEALVQGGVVLRF